MQSISPILAFTTVTARAIARSGAYRWLLGAALICTVLTALVFPPFLFFADAQTQASLVASNAFLWSVLYAFFALPLPASFVASRHVAPFFHPGPTSSWQWAIGRLLGSLIPFLLGGLLVIGIGSGLASLVIKDRLAADFGVLLLGSLSHLLVGVVAVCGVLLLSQSENGAVAAAGGIAWFAIGSQKAAALAPLGDGSLFVVASIALAWLPDSVALFGGSNADNLGGVSMWTQLGYAGLFAGLNVCFAVIWVEVRPERQGRI